MTPDSSPSDLDQQISERFAELPKVVQDAITSADIEQRLRTLADSHKLHLDQWDKLENEVMLTLLGFQAPEDLSKNIADVVGLDTDTATTLATDINHIVFEPVRQELERQLSHPEAQTVSQTDVESMQQQILSSEHQTTVVAPATPPTAPPTEKAVRADLSTTYIPNTPSHERKTIEGDPYREQIV